MRPRSKTDQKLLLELREGNHNAFKEIYTRYWDKLFYLAGKKLHDLPEAESIVQDVFVDLWQRRETIEIQDALDGYLIVAVKYRILNYLARQYRLRAYQLFAEERLTAADHTTEEWISFGDLKEWLDKIVNRLPEKCQLAYRLRDEGLSQKEIAQKMQISEKTVETHISRALKTVRTGISELFSTINTWCMFF